MARVGSKERKTLLWTVLSGCVYALSSVVFLMVVSRALGDTAAGVYATASMMALQLITVGRFSVRNFQVSDVHDEYTFSEYYSFRCLSCGLMILALIVWAVVAGYRGATFFVILCFGIYKACDAFADVLEGQMQRLGHLDRAGQCQLMMNIVLIACFVAGVLVGRVLMDPQTALLMASIVLAVMSIITVAVIYLPIMMQFGLPKFQLSGRAVKGLFVACVSLFLSSFFYSFMNNVPRYAITALYEQEEGFMAVGKFSQLFIPVFAVDLFASFTMRTWQTTMAEQVKNGAWKDFRKKYLLQAAVTIGVTALAVVVAYTIGTPVLGWFYQTDLSMYRMELVILMLAGGFVAIQTLLENMLTIFRGQKLATVANVPSIALGCVATWLLVKNYGITGAVYGYLITAGLRALFFGIVTFLCKIRLFQQNKAV